MPTTPAPAPSRRWHVVRLTPFERVDDIPFTDRRDDLMRRYGPAPQESRNAVELTELDYGDRVFRFQDSGRLEEITLRAPVLEVGGVAIPFASLAEFVRRHDRHAFERAGFLISPQWGLAFVPHQPDWVTALARHCLPAWRAIDHPAGS